MTTPCGIEALMVVCTYDGIGKCFYPSGPCRIGRERRKAGEACVSRSAYAAHLPEVEEGGKGEGR